MPAPTKLVKLEKAYHVKDDSKRLYSITRLQFHPTEARLLASVVDSKLAVWDLEGPLVADLKSKTSPAVAATRHCAHEAGWIRDFDLTADGKRLATGGSDRRLCLWRWTSGKPDDRPLVAVDAHEGWVEALGFSPDGKLLASIGSDRLLKLWNSEDLKLVRSLPSRHTGVPRDLCWTRDGKHLVTGGEDGKVIVWNASTFEPVRTLDFGDTNEQQGQHPNVSGVHRLACSPDNRWLVAAGDRKVAVYSLDKGDLVATDQMRLQGVFHPSADVLAAGGDNVKVWSYEPAKLTPLAANKGGKNAFPGKELGAVKLGDFSLGLAFSPDGQLLALGQSSGRVEVWKVV